ncbi:MAG: hypothetical protein ACOYOK_10165 [Pseudobdellovibrionaceae bacterium]
MNLKISLPFLFVFILSPLVFAQLQVFPLRVTLSEKEKSAQVSLRHRGEKKVKYKISTVFYKMMPDGAMVAIDKADVKDTTAADLFRYSPKQVDMDPNVEQVVRLLWRAPADLPEGEYRTHLHFEEIIEKTSGEVATTGTTAQIEMNVKMAVAIPVIVRKGKVEAKAEIVNLRLLNGPDQKPRFSFDLNKTGSGFLYGDLELYSTPEGSTTPKLITTIFGVSSYIEKRSVTYPLEEKPPLGKFKVLFKNPAKDGDDVFAQSEIISK